MRKLIFVLLLGYSNVAGAQIVGKYDQFEIIDDDMVWTNTYSQPGSRDSVRAAVVQMIKSKFFTFNVIRNETGYNGEIKHYTINCKKYGRSYINTPKMYWEGEWSGKFKVEVTDNYYKVTVYALYYESTRPSGGYYKTQETVKGRFITAVTKKNKLVFRKRELANISLMSISLKDEFSLLSAKK